MEQEYSYWRLVAKLSAVVACVLVLSVTSCTIAQNRTLGKLVESGSNPLDASCAIYANQNTCIAAGGSHDN